MGACGSKEKDEKAEAQRQLVLQIQKEQQEQADLEVKFGAIRDTLNQLELDKLQSTTYVIVEDDMNKIIQGIEIEKADLACVKVLKDIQNSTMEVDQDIITHFKTMNPRQQYFLVEYLRVVAKLIELNKDLKDDRSRYWCESLQKYKTPVQPQVTLMNNDPVEAHK